MELQQARALADEVVALLAPHCAAIQVVGSIRRQKPFPRDIDIVMIPEHQGQLAVAIAALGKKVKDGPRIATRWYKSRMVDLYIADLQSWHTLLLIRTGSKEHNIKLTTLAKQRGWHLYADGKGLYDADGKRMAGDSEESFFEALGIPYSPPEQRR